MADVTRYPLSWPAGWKRTAAHQRRWSPFKTGKSPITVAAAINRLQDELQRIGARDEALSTNLPVKLNGLPYSSDNRLADPGAAVYFKLKGQDRCLACDRYADVAGNIAAIAAHIEAFRAIDRYGVGTLEQAFAGYTALPPAADAWWLVFNLPQTATLDQVEEEFRRLAQVAHPDKEGGSEHRMAMLTAAREAARKAKR